MQNDKLLPCPFCDKKLKKFKGGYEHKSSQCVLSSFILTDVEISKWNTRKPMERIVEQLEQLRNYYEKYHGVVMGFKIALNVVRKGGVDNAG